MGILKKEATGANGVIPFNDFVRDPPVARWIRSLESARNRSATKKHKYAGTAGIYANRLHHFHVWLIGKKLNLRRLVQISEKTFEERGENVVLDGVSHFLKLYAEPNAKQQDCKAHR